MWEWQRLKFSEVDYVGIDISIRIMQSAAEKIPENNWRVQFVRTSANTPIFADDSLDNVFSASDLHLNTSIKPSPLCRCEKSPIIDRSTSARIKFFLLQSADKINNADDRG